MNSKKKKNLFLSLVKPLAGSDLDRFKHLSKAEIEIDENLHKLGNLHEVKEIGQVLHLLCNLTENITCVKLTGQEKKDFVIKKLLSFKPDYNNETDLKWVNIMIDTLCIVGAVSKVESSKIALQSIKSLASFFLKN